MIIRLFKKIWRNFFGKTFKILPENIGA